MKRLYFLSLIICALTFTGETSCMRAVLRGQKISRHGSARRYHYARPITRAELLYKIKLLEAEMLSQQQQLANIKATVGKWNNNDQAHILYENLPASSPDTYISDHNMHYGNTTH